MIETFVQLEECINKCLLPKLAKGFNESESHTEYSVRNSHLETYIQKLHDLLQCVDLKEHPELESCTLYGIYILYLELTSVGPWNVPKGKIKGYADKLNDIFKIKYGVALEDILKETAFNVQEVFDKCIKELHQKMTLENLKKYPGLIEVYCSIIKNVKEYKVSINPMTVLPISLLLMDDYVTSNKVKGLQCCTIILQCLKADAFTSGNYYEVVYMNLKKNFGEKDLEVTEHLYTCILEFVPVLPPDVQKNKLDDIYSNILEQLLIETNLYRKQKSFIFATKIIEIHRIHCVKKKIFKDIIYDNIELCTNEGVSEILLNNVLECFETWIKYCWCVWKLSSHQKMLLTLIKILYVVQEETTLLNIEKLILTLLSLCSEEEKRNIFENLSKITSNANKDFVNRLDEIKLKLYT